MYKVLLCLRYLKTRYIALASIVSVMLGVATMIVVNSVMAGFSTEMKDRLKGVLADVIIATHSMDGVPDAEGMKARVRQVAGDKIAGVTESIEVFGMLHFTLAGTSITRPVKLIGIDPEGKSSVGPLKSYLQSYQPEMEDGRVVAPPQRAQDAPAGWELTAEAKHYRREWYENEIKFREQVALHRKLAAEDAQSDAETGSGLDFQNPFDDAATNAGEPAATIDPEAPLEGRLYVGAGLISQMDIDPETGKTRPYIFLRTGDDVKITTATAGTPPKPAYFGGTIVDVFKSGMSEYDSQYIFCNIDYLQKIRGMIDPASGQRSITQLQIRLKNYADAPEVVEKLRAAFPIGLYRVETWEQNQGPLLAAVDMETSILNVLLFLIIAVAGFGILAIFFMIVVEKTKDIGILKALGASSRGVMSIFLAYGLSLGIVGAGVGAIAGLVFVANINEIESGLCYLTGRKVFDDRIYYFPKIPTYTDPWMVTWVAVGAMLIAVTASILPARRAAMLRPVEALRHE